MDVLTAALLTLPVVLTSAADPRPTGQTPEGVKTAQVAVLRGRVTNDEGAPLAGVRVRVALAVTDMRFVDATTGQTLVEARSDAKGEYRLELPKVAKPTTISVDAMKPGYQRLAGTLMAGGDDRRVEVAPGKESKADLTLEPARYLAGVVYDEKGKPIPGVQIGADLEFANGEAGVERIASNPDGSFELFGFPGELQDFPQAIKGVVTFSHPNYVGQKFEDVYVLGKDQLGALKIVLDPGHKLAGTVLDEAGKPVANATVKVLGDDTPYRKATLTDANGTFVLRGLNDGLAKLSVRALAIKQKAEMPITLDADRNGLEVRLRTIALPADLKTHDVLGMRLADVTPGLKSAYDLHQDKGALILDPGKDSGRLDVGDLNEGYVFWMVGETRVGGVSDFVNRLLAETAGIDAETYSVQVVYGFSTVEFDGTNTQHLKLTKDDVKRLRIVADRLQAGSR